MENQLIAKSETHINVSQTQYNAVALIKELLAKLDHGQLDIVLSLAIRQQSKVKQALHEIFAA